MYDKPELTLVGPVAGVVLGDEGPIDDNDLVPQLPGEGVVLGLDD